MAENQEVSLRMKETLDLAGGASMPKIARVMKP